MPTRRLWPPPRPRTCSPAEEHSLTSVDVAGNTAGYPGAQRYDPARRVLISYCRWREGDTPRQTLTRAVCQVTHAGALRALLAANGRVEEARCGG